MKPKQPQVLKHFGLISNIKHLGFLWPPIILCTLHIYSQINLLFWTMSGATHLEKEGRSELVLDWSWRIWLHFTVWMYLFVKEYKVYSWLFFQKLWVVLLIQEDHKKLNISWAVETSVAKDLSTNYITR